MTYAQPTRPDLLEFSDPSAPSAEATPTSSATGPPGSSAGAASSSSASAGAYQQPAPPPADDPFDADAIARDQEELHLAALADSEAKKLKARAKAQKQVEEEEQGQRRLVLEPMSSFTMARTKWLWRGRIPVGEITVILGKGGIGKSQIMAMLTAWLSTGRMKGEFKGTPRNVIYVANEDSIEKTVFPRLAAAGADPSRVFRMTLDLDGGLGRIDLRRDLEDIAAKAQEIDAAAVMFDPLSSNLGVKSNSGDEVRPLFEALRAMAEEQQIAIVGLGHMKKGTVADALEGYLGSSEMGNVLRAAMAVVKDEDDDSGGIVLSQVKNNLGRMDLPSYKLHIVTRQVTDAYGRTFVTSGIDEEGIEETDQNAEEMMREAMAFGETRTKVREAADFLLDYLVRQGGQASRKDVMNAAKGDGLSQSTIERAARKLKIVSSRSGGFPSGTMWEVPSTTRSSHFTDEVS